MLWVVNKHSICEDQMQYSVQEKSIEGSALREPCSQNAGLPPAWNQARGPAS